MRVLLLRSTRFFFVAPPIILNLLAGIDIGFIINGYIKKKHLGHVINKKVGALQTYLYGVFFLLSIVYSRTKCLHVRRFMLDRTNNE